MYGQPGKRATPLYFVIERRRLLSKFSTMSFRRRLDKMKRAGKNRPANFIMFPTIVRTGPQFSFTCLKFLFWLHNASLFILKTMHARYNASNKYGFDIVRHNIGSLSISRGIIN